MFKDGSFYLRKCVPTSSCRLKGGPQSYNNDTLCGALGGLYPGVSLFSLVWTLSKVSASPNLPLTLDFKFFLETR